MKTRSGNEAADSYTSFGDSSPMGLWDEGRKTADFQGPFVPIGGSNPNCGFSTWDDFGEDTGNQLTGGGPGSY